MKLSSSNMFKDGREAMSVYLNGKEICTSQAQYGTSYSGSNTASNWTTIDRMTDCMDVIPTKKGDYIALEAFYDAIKHPL